MSLPIHLWKMNFVSACFVCSCLDKKQGDRECQPSKGSVDPRPFCFDHFVGRRAQDPNGSKWVQGPI